MTVVNIGSLNVDYVYSVDHFVRPGETLACAGFERFAGGKGLNQSVALARAGAAVRHAGKVGRDGEWLRALLAAEGVDVGLVETVDGPTGHAVIQVNREGQNAIVIHGGANRAITRDDAVRIVRGAKPGDFLLLQNEVSCVADAIAAGREAGLRVVFNPAPMDMEVLRYPLSLVDVFVMNELEGEALTGVRDHDRILDAMRSRFPDATVALTLGSRGAAYAAAHARGFVPAEKVEAVDTTAAGDTFVGYLAAELAAGAEMERAVRIACAAAAICVTRRGAAQSIPRRSELRLLSGGTGASGARC